MGNRRWENIPPYHQKWENLPLDCLSNIFSRVGALSLVEDVQYVCKSWHEATLSPLCWQSIFVKHILKNVDDCFKISGFKNFVKIVIHRSHGAANAVALLEKIILEREVLDIIGEGCPSLKRLVLSTVNPFDLSTVICKWNNLEGLRINPVDSWEVIIHEINAHCKKFVSLSVFDTSVSDREAYAISTLLPNIEFLSLKGSLIERSSLLTILKGCKKLVHFDAGLWRRFDLDDEIKNLAADIDTFNFVIDSDSDSGYWSSFTYWLDYHRNRQQAFTETRSEEAGALSSSESDYPKLETKEDIKKRKEDIRKRKEDRRKIKEDRRIRKEKKERREKKKRKGRKEEKRERKGRTLWAPKVHKKREWYDTQETDYYDL